MPRREKVAGRDEENKKEEERKSCLEEGKWASRHEEYKKVKKENHAQKMESDPVGMKIIKRNI